MEFEEIMGGRYGRFICGRRYDLLTHARYWTELAVEKKFPAMQPYQAAELEKVARKAALATGVITPEAIEKRKTPIALYPQHLDDDVARVSVRGMLVICMESIEVRNQAVGYFKNWLRRDPRGRGFVDAIAAEQSELGELARKFLKPAEIRDAREAEQAAAWKARQEESAAHWRAQNPGRADGSEELENPTPSPNSTRGPLAERGAEAAAMPEVASVDELKHGLSEAINKSLPSNEQTEAAIRNAIENAVTGEAVATKFNGGGAHNRQLGVRASAVWVVVAKEKADSDAEVLEELSGKPDWAEKVAEAEGLGIARLYLYERSPDGKEMDNVESWPRVKR